MIRSILCGISAGLTLFVSALFPLTLMAQIAPEKEAAERDMRRVSDLALIKEAIGKYRNHYWSFPGYSLESPAMSDDYWRKTGQSRDFRKRLRPYLNYLPIDPQNDGSQGFHYVYHFMPPNAPPEWSGCAGRSILYARVETADFVFQQCPFTGDERRTVFVINEEITKAPSLFAAVLTSFSLLFTWQW